MLPEITEAVQVAVKSFLQWKEENSRPLSLELKGQNVIGDEWYARNGFPNLYDLHGGGGASWSGEVVSEAAATNLSTVWACRRIIAGSGAMIPLDMMRKTPAGKFPCDGQDIPVHPLYGALKHAPNEEMSSLVWREAHIGNLLMAGNAYGQIYRRSGTGVAYEIEPLQTNQVHLDRDSEKRRVYVINPNLPGAKTYTVERGKVHDVLHVIGPSITGRSGQGIITQARQSLGVAQAAERYAARFYGSGARVPGVIEQTQKIFKNDEEYKKFRADWNDFYGSAENWHKAVIMEPGMTYKQTGLNAEDSQFLATRQFSVSDLCRWFLISPDMVGDMSKATLNNMEQLALRFVKWTLTEWLVRIEQDFWRCLLSPAEKTQGYYFAHNVNGMLRGDYASRMAGYAQALQNGFKNIDQVRDLEDENPLPNGAGQAYHIQMNLATVPGTGTPMVAEQGILNRMSAPAKPAAAA